jgi:hypothetical protein
MQGPIVAKSYFERPGAVNDIAKPFSRLDGKGIAAAQFMAHHAAGARTDAFEYLPAGPGDRRTPA